MWARLGRGGEILQGDRTNVIDIDFSDHPAGHSDTNGKWGKTLVHKRTGADQTMIADLNALGEDGIRSDVATVADFYRRSIIRSLAPREGPHHRIVRIDMDTGSDAAIVADLQSSRPIKEGERTDPRLFPDFYVTVDIAIVIDAGAFSETQAFRPFPTIREDFVKGEISIPFRPNGLAEILVQLD
jgi:hypothetical protein